MVTLPTGMTLLQYAAAMGELSALQNQVASMAIRLGIDKADFVEETAKGYDALLSAYKTVVAVLETDILGAKAKA